MYHPNLSSRRQTPAPNGSLGHPLPGHLKKPQLFGRQCPEKWPALLDDRKTSTIHYTLNNHGNNVYLKLFWPGSFFCMSFTFTWMCAFLMLNKTLSTINLRFAAVEKKTKASTHRKPMKILPTAPCNDTWIPGDAVQGLLETIRVFPKMVGIPPKSSVLIGFSIINHSFWGTPIFGNTYLGAIAIWHLKMDFYDMCIASY